MAQMTLKEQQDLAEELSRYSFGKATGKLRRLDSKNELAFFRNSQTSSTMQTRYNLPSKGIAVTLIEKLTEGAPNEANLFKPEFSLQEVIVESLAE